MLEIAGEYKVFGLRMENVRLSIFGKSCPSEKVKTEIEENERKIEEINRELHNSQDESSYGLSKAKAEHPGRGSAGGGPWFNQYRGYS